MDPMCDVQGAGEMINKGNSNTLVCQPKKATLGPSSLIADPRNSTLGRFEHLRARTVCKNLNTELRQDFADFTPSRLFIYYNERLMEGSVGQDAGAMIRDGIKTMSKVGVCPESVWKYDDGPNFFKQQPDSKAYEIAQKCRVMGYARVAQDLSQMKMCIKHGYPFVFGFTVLSSFQTMEVARTGKMVMPQANDRMMGGHAVCAVGYDDFQQCFIVRNSWGEGLLAEIQRRFASIETCPAPFLHSRFQVGRQGLLLHALRVHLAPPACTGLLGHQLGGGLQERGYKRPQEVSSWALHQISSCLLLFCVGFTLLLAE